MWRAFALLLLPLMFSGLSATDASAQEPAAPEPQQEETESKFEISPFFGLRTAGSFRPETDEPSPDLEFITYRMSSAPTFGAFFDYNFTNNIAAEALWTYQGSKVVQETATLDGSVVPDEDLFDMSINYLHGGIRYSGGNEKYDPFVAAGVGVATFSPDGGDSFSKFSFTIGTGLIANINERIAIRAEARAFGTRAGDRQEDINCGVFGCVSFTRASTFWQSHFVGAVVFRF